MKKKAKETRGIFYIGTSSTSSEIKKKKKNIYLKVFFFVEDRIVGGCFKKKKRWSARVERKDYVVTQQFEGIL